ncbi:ribosomal protein S8 [Laetiporus sulphureus 93-53]|uniref:Ribosomal protein S8 n=1 Tax=Laetiporus sulphureus 93-53 TaxID=1314785 RepID=A0A165AT08_9APHY|nr:ribosomal protein S8 [Laetiporus sulphureus 93-53]KZS99599.1 ribosomal protein S8 [Laetiporus sulphureus 93-53]
MVHAHELCSSLQNAFRVRQQRIAVPHTTAILRNGFITSMYRGTVGEPDPLEFLDAGVAQRRIWVDLKYREERPVLNAMELVSKPSKAVLMDLDALRLICSGRRTQGVKPLRMGEIAIVRTKNQEHEWVEAREALQLNLGGEIICRAR